MSGRGRTGGAPGGTATGGGYDATTYTAAQLAALADAGTTPTPAPASPWPKLYAASDDVTRTWIVFSATSAVETTMAQPEVLTPQIGLAVVSGVVGDTPTLVGSIDTKGRSCEIRLKWAGPGGSAPVRLQLKKRYSGASVGDVILDSANGAFDGDNVNDGRLASLTASPIANPIWAMAPGGYFTIGLLPSPARYIDVYATASDAGCTMDIDGGRG